MKIMVARLQAKLPRHSAGQVAGQKGGQVLDVVALVDLFFCPSREWSQPDTPDAGVSVKIPVGAPRCSISGRPASQSFRCPSSAPQTSNVKGWPSVQAAVRGHPFCLRKDTMSRRSTCTSSSLKRGHRSAASTCANRRGIRFQATTRCSHLTTHRRHLSIEICPSHRLGGARRATRLHQHAHQTLTNHCTKREPVVTDHTAKSSAASARTSRTRASICRTCCHTCRRSNHGALQCKA